MTVSSRIACGLLVAIHSALPVVGQATEQDGFEVCACVEEIPGVGGCSFIGAPVTLEPLGLQAVSPRACFSHVPPGDYLVRTVCGSNPYGCPRPTRLTVVDSDIQVFVRAVSPCAGHCTYSGSIRIADLIRCVAISQEYADLSACWACDRNYDDAVSVDELVLAVAAALNSCTDTLPFH